MGEEPLELQIRKTLPEFYDLLRIQEASHRQDSGAVVRLLTEISQMVRDQRTMPAILKFGQSQMPVPVSSATAPAPVSYDTAGLAAAATVSSSNAAAAITATATATVSSSNFAAAATLPSSSTAPSSSSITSYDPKSPLFLYKISRTMILQHESYCTFFGNIFLAFTLYGQNE
ncbi:MAG: hypothetical protein MMC33_007503 [Icmadophila ericetorum]|nr:hypothetical protein [Icmadophila ericetorum]